MCIRDRHCYLPSFIYLLESFTAVSYTHLDVYKRQRQEYNTTEWFKKTYKKTPVEYFNSIGFLDENSVLAHQVQTTDKDIKILQKTKTQIVHNPLANTILGSGMPPIIKMLDAGIRVAISTDGSGSADNQNILSAARLASQYQKALHKNAKLLPAQKVLEMITVEPAKMLRLNAGSIDAGKDADIILLDTSRPNMTPSKIENIVENLIWASDGSEVKYVVANGKMLLENKKYKTIDSEKVLHDIQDLSEKFEIYRKKAKKIKGTGVHK